MYRFKDSTVLNSAKNVPMIFISSSSVVVARITKCNVVILHKIILILIKTHTDFQVTTNLHHAVEIVKNDDLCCSCWLEQKVTDRNVIFYTYVPLYIYIRVQKSNGALLGKDQST